MLRGLDSTLIVYGTGFIVGAIALRAFMAPRAATPVSSPAATTRVSGIAGSDQYQSQRIAHAEDELNHVPGVAPTAVFADPTTSVTASTNLRWDQSWRLPCRQRGTFTFDATNFATGLTIGFGAGMTNVAGGYLLQLNALTRTGDTFTAVSDIRTPETYSVVHPIGAGRDFKSTDDTVAYRVTYDTGRLDVEQDGVLIITLSLPATVRRTKPALGFSQLPSATMPLVAFVGIGSTGARDRIGYINNFRIVRPR